MSSRNKSEISKEIRHVLSLEDDSNIPEWVHFFENNPKFLNRIWDMVKTGLVNNSLPTLLKQLVMIKVSRHGNSPYCEARHIVCTMKLTQLSYSEIIDIVEFRSQGIVPDRYVEALELTHKILTSDCSIHNNIRSEFCAAGYTDEDFLSFCELMCVCHYATMLTKMIELPVDSDIEKFLKKSDVLA